MQKLDDLVQLYVHEIVVDIEALLIDEDYYARAEDHPIISDMISAMCLHIES